MLRDTKTTLFWPTTNYAVSVECFDGFYRVTLTNFYTVSPSPHNLELREKSRYKMTKQYYSVVDNRVNELLNELNVFVRTELKGTK
ncbi:hypothetical protein GCM10028818_22930 [Spirosoma horti]